MITPAFLSHLKSLYPGASPSENPWYTVAAVAFSASNLPEAVPIVFQYALNDLPESTDHHADALLLVQKIKDALFKSGLLSGYPKAINALAALQEVLPETLRDNSPLRDVAPSTEHLTRVGREYWSRTYGEDSEFVLGLVTEIYPDLAHFSTAFAYGYAYSFLGVLSATETSFAIVAALIASDTPRQIGWHLKGATRNGASVAQVRAVRQISIEVAQSAGVRWKNEIPDIS